ncbi:MAG: DUF4923 family protein [Prevotellamassilia sp.]|nr:DUF4923 family protein [Prevotellamassilia sp.]
MKKFFFSTALLLGTMLFAACGTTGLMSGTNAGTSTTTTTTTTTSLINGLLSGLIGQSASISQDKIVGTWNYSEPDCVFESENFLAKAGGEVAASKVEAKLVDAYSKVGVKKGTCSFTFNSDGTYTAVIGGYSINGNYTVNSADNTVKMTYLAGIKTVQPKVVLSGNTLSILYPSDKLLTMVSSLSALSSQATTLKSVIGSYDGMYLGFKLTK